MRGDPRGSNDDAAFVRWRRRQVMTTTSTPQRNPSPAHGRRMLVSIHDVGPRFETEVLRLAERLEHHLGSRRFAMLVVPDHWGEAPLGSNRTFCARLRRWADDGVEMFVHGWTHRDDCSHRSVRARFKARHMTAREGEFLGLDHGEALRRMVAGRRLLEDVTGKAPVGFIAPAWLYGDGARRALAEAGFAIAEDHNRVWRPSDGAILARGPVVTWASRTRARRANSIALTAMARFALRPLRMLRVAVHPGDVHVPRLLTSIDATLSSACRYRTVGQYGDLLDELPAAGQATTVVAATRRSPVGRSAVGASH